MSEQEQNTTAAVPEEEQSGKQVAPPVPPPDPEAGYRPEPMPIIHDEMSISYDEILDLLKKKTGTIVGKNDPIMMMVPFLNAFLDLEIKIVNRHHEALAHTMSQRTETFVTAVQTTVDGLEQTLSSKTLEGLTGVFKEHLMAMNKYQEALRKLSWFVGVGIIFQIGILFGLAIGLFTMSK